jgi:hypothetical protein
MQDELEDQIEEQAPQPDESVSGGQPNATNAQSMSAYVLARMFFVKENSYEFGAFASNAINALKDVNPDDAKEILQMSKAFVDLLVLQRNMLDRLISDRQQIPVEFDQKANKIVARKFKMAQTSKVDAGGNLVT